MQVKPGKYRLGAYPSIVQHWHPVRNGKEVPDDFMPGSNKIVWLQCPTCAHEWQARCQSLTRYGGNVACPACLLRDRRDGDSIVQKSLPVTVGVPSESDSFGVDIEVVGEGAPPPTTLPARQVCLESLSKWLQVTEGLSYWLYQ